MRPLSEGDFPACHFGSRQRERARRTLICEHAFLPFLLFRFLIWIELSVNNGGMAFYFDFSLLLAALCVPVAFIGEIKAEPLPFKANKALFLYFHHNHVAGFRAEPFFS